MFPILLSARRVSAVDDNADSDRMILSTGTDNTGTQTVGIQYITISIATHE